MQTIRLCKGRGTESKSHCVMAATSIVADEKFSEHPVCVCPTITKVLIIVNDRCPSDEIRERLLGHLPWLIIGTRSTDNKVLVNRTKAFVRYAEITAANAANVARAAAARAVDANAYYAARAAVAAARAAVAHATAAAAIGAAAATRAADTAITAIAAVAAADAAAAATRAADAAAVTAANAINSPVWETEMKKFIDFIEEEIIPMYTTMTVEPACNIEKLIKV
jgi:hypothetical protein